MDGFKVCLARNSELQEKLGGLGLQYGVKEGEGVTCVCVCLCAVMRVEN